MLPIKSDYVKWYYMKFFLIILLIVVVLIVVFWAKKKGRRFISWAAFICTGYLVICAAINIVDLPAALTANYDYVVGKPIDFDIKTFYSKGGNYKRIYFKIGNEDFALNYDQYKQYMDVFLQDETCTVIVFPCTRRVIDIRSTPSKEDLEIRKQDAKIINFKDKNLEQAIKRDLYATQITRDTLRKVKELCLRDANIVSLEGLQYAQQLEKLDLSHNKINNITPLKDLENLKNLNLAHNKITSIKEIEELKNIQELRLQDNYIQDIKPLMSLENLTVLYISDNSMRDVSMLDRISGLQTLESSNNPRKDIIDSGFDEENFLDAVKNIEIHMDNE